MKKRREFLKKATGVGMACMTPSILLSQSSTPAPHISSVKAKALKKGDTIGLVAPGFAIPLFVLEKAKETLIKMGFIPYHTDRILGNHGYFSNTDEERAADLNEMFANPKIDGILCARGGYGCTRIMHMIDYDIIRNNPKTFIGFSDITALLNGIYQKTGLITFHGPVGSTITDDYSIAQLKRVVMHTRAKQALKNKVYPLNSEFKKPEYDQYIICPGKVSGKLVGGSLTLVSALVGTPDEIDFTDAIVCLEEIEEAPYRIDRMLTQLIHSKTFHKAAGFALGVFKGCDRIPAPTTFTLKEVIMDRIAPLNVPAVYGLTFGHIDHNFTFPIGTMASLDADKMKLTLLETSVQ
ncbi:S66 peptidase family protein [Arenibacter latericius]|uniref:S66 peptidase family protein n=1 Tax=Arenibacter latericius TaxID=86104 RepID=UPI0004064220|nr:LD-carboxypeptidase [Arenibacter latericius]MDX1365277.1 LD-carboxypeptidase [Arenibacter latericius]